MEFGASIFFTDYSITPAELGQALEERGFDSVWAAEHSHIPVPRKTRADQDLGKRYYDVMDPFVTLTAAACATKRLKLATGICLVIQRDTIQTAKLVASIDQVSGGRFLFGIGGGWNQEEIENHGTAFSSRMQKMREQIEAMRRSGRRRHPNITARSSNSTRSRPGQSRCRSRTRRSSSAALFPGRRGARCGTATAGTRTRRAGSRRNICRRSARWRRRPGAIPPHCRSRSAARPTIPMR